MITCIFDSKIGKLSLKKKEKRRKEKKGNKAFHFFFSVSDDEMFGDFEDLETGEVHTADDKRNSEREGQEDEQDESEEEKTDGADRRMEMKKKQKAAFDATYPF